MNGGMMGMAEWRNGGMAEWRNGGMVEWRDGGMAEWRNGGMAEWRNGRMTGMAGMARMAEWRNGRMAEWRDGGMAGMAGMAVMVGMADGGVEWLDGVGYRVLNMIIESQIIKPYLSKVASTDKHIITRCTPSRFEILQNSLNKYAVI